MRWRRQARLRNHSLLAVFVSRPSARRSYARRADGPCRRTRHGEAMNVAVSSLDHVGTVTSASVTSNGHDAGGVDVGGAAKVDEIWAVATWRRRVS